MTAVQGVSDLNWLEKTCIMSKNKKVVFGDQIENLDLSPGKNSRESRMPLNTTMGLG